jgi:hypothetical protein
MRGAFWSVVAVPLLFGGCAAKPSPGTWQASTCGCPEDPFARRLDRGDWLVSTGQQVSLVLEEQEGTPPRRIGYLVGKDYKQGRGKGTFRVWQVTTLNRDEVIGQIDGMGRAERFEPRRGGGYDRVDVGSSTMTENVAAIFQTKARITIQATTARRLAFESLDENGNGLLEASEVPAVRVGDRIANADVNRDGVVDFQEFDALDQL